ncbi:hypothetical protein BKA57DRAFT_502067 [Linnemannia elongata]|nr:hypothetical protein BKA57DRAFT_502067 [Linnemannia elongata]
MTFKNRFVTYAAFMACLVLTLQPSVDTAPAPQQPTKDPMGISETLYSQCFNAPSSPVADSADEEVSKTDKCLDSAFDDWVVDKFADAVQQQHYKETQLENDDKLRKSSCLEEIGKIKEIQEVGKGDDEKERALSELPSVWTSGWTNSNGSLLRKSLVIQHLLNPRQLTTRSPCTRRQCQWKARYSCSTGTEAGQRAFSSVEAPQLHPRRYGRSVHGMFELEHEMDKAEICVVLKARPGKLL